MKQNGISIHAPTKGATPPRLPRVCRLQYFNPRSHEGSDFKGDCSKVILPRISIHAPTKGATLSDNPFALQVAYFNPRSHEGSDGCDRSSWHFIVNFNPRSHEGSDNSLAGIIFHLQISIHAPTKGATAILSNFTSYIFQFPLIFTNIFLLIFYLYHLPITFVHLFWCESSYTTVSTYHSHSNHIIRTSSAEIPLSTPTCSIFVLY